jgi:uncharacterized membrane protein YhaH (DUF805 family)
MTIGQWFGFQGRIRRRTWWLLYVLPLVGLSVVATVLDIALGFVALEDAQPADGYAFQATGIGVFGLVALVISVWGGLAGQVKRWHDRDKSGWFVLVNFIPFIGAIWVLVELGFLRGTAGPNRFGPDPLGGQGAPQPQWQPGGPQQGWQQPAPQWQPPPPQGWQPPPQQSWHQGPAGPVQGQPPQGYGQPPPGYGQPPPGYGQPPPGYGQPPPGYGQPPPGYGQPPPGQGGPPPGYGQPPQGPWTGPGAGGSVPPVRRD